MSPAMGIGRAMRTIATNTMKEAETATHHMHYHRYACDDNHKEKQDDKQEEIKHEIAPPSSLSVAVNDRQEQIPHDGGRHTRYAEQ